MQALTKVLVGRKEKNAEKVGRDEKNQRCAVVEVLITGRYQGTRNNKSSEQSHLNQNTNWQTNKTFCAEREKSSNINY